MLYIVSLLINGESESGSVQPQFRFPVGQGKCKCLNHQNLTCHWGKERHFVRNESSISAGEKIPGMSQAGQTGFTEEKQGCYANQIKTRDKTTQTLQATQAPLYGACCQ